MDKHELLLKLKEMIDLRGGEIPTRDEFIKEVSKHSLTREFGTYQELLKAFGIDSKRKIKIENPFIVKDLQSYYDNKPVIEPKKLDKYPKIAAISDIHWPFQSDRVINKFLAHIEKHQPEYVFVNGDAWDMYSFSKFPRSHNIFTPREERDLSRKLNEEFWVKVKDKCPKAKCIQMLGNHELRVMKRIMEQYPVAEDWIQEALKKEFTFEGVETIFDPRQEYMIGNIAVFHGYRTKLGDHRDYTHYNCIIGHTHRGGTVFKNIRDTVLWELNSGLAGDPLSKGLSYTTQRINDWTMGFAWVDEDGPRFIMA